MDQGHLTFESTSGRVPAFFVKPASPSGAVVVLHEVSGLVPHIEDICKRISKLGFTAVAPDLYWKHGELLVPEKIRTAMEGVWNLSVLERRDATKVREALAKGGFSDEIMQVATTLYNKDFRDQILDSAVACVKYMYERTRRVASLGFSLGGGISARVATRFPQLTACIVFYGEPPETSEVQKIRAPILAIHAEQDEIINSKIPEFVHAAIASGKDLTLKVYPATRHGFFNDTKKEIYNGAAAGDAWELTKWFLSRRLRQ